MWILKHDSVHAHTQFSSPHQPSIDTLSCGSVQNKTYSVGDSTKRRWRCVSFRKHWAETVLFLAYLNQGSKIQGSPCPRLGWLIKSNILSLLKVTVSLRAVLGDLNAIWKNHQGRTSNNGKQKPYPLPDASPLLSVQICSIGSNILGGYVWLLLWWICLHYFTGFSSLNTLVMSFVIYKIYR